jgi:hypothetical protein
VTGAICSSLAPEAVRKAAASALTPSEGGSGGAPLPLSRNAASGCCWLGRRLLRLEAAGCVGPAAACCFDIFTDGMAALAQQSDMRLQPIMCAAGAPQSLANGALCRSEALIALYRTPVFRHK